MRFLAEITPYLISTPRLGSALPMANDQAPSLTFLGSMKRGSLRSRASILSSASPAARSMPSSCAACARPSLVVTMVASGLESKFHAEVRMKPSSLIIRPLVGPSVFLNPGMGG